MRAAPIIGLALMSACTVKAGYDDTSFLCTESEPCPSGQMCVDGVCRSDGPEVDASLVDGNSADANNECQESLALSDDFENSEIDPQWQPFADSNVTVIEEDGLLKVTLDSVASIREGGYRSTEMFDLTGSRIYVEVPTMVDVASEREVRMAIGADTQNFYFVEQQQGTLSVGALVDGTRSESNAPYDEVEHRWWQLREADGVVIAEVSGDGMDWQELGRYTTEVFAISMSIELRLQGRAPGVLDSVHFDNFNVGDDCP